MPDDNPPLQSTPAGSTPVPDPTALTSAAVKTATEQIRRDMIAERDYVNGQIEAIKARLTGMDSATELRLKGLDHVPSVIDEKVGHLQNLMDERFHSLDDKFGDIASRTAEQKLDCVEASTPVLCADLVWRPAGSLVVGDELITVDDLAVTAPGTRTPRRFRRGVVTANSLQDDELVRVSTPVGDLLCNSHHPILVKRPTGLGAANRLRYWHWVPASELRDGDQLAHVVDVWDVDKSWEGGWLAGMYDGEGCLTFYTDKRFVSSCAAKLTMVQRVSPTADLIEQALKARLATFTMIDKGVPDGCQPQLAFAVSQRADVMKILGSVRPPRLMVRADEVWEGQSIGGRGRAVPLLGVEPVGVGRIAMLSVSTGTYIAGGFASHNTKGAVDAALQAAKEAVTAQTDASEKSIAKSETATTERIKAVEQTASVSTAAAAQQINDLKERIVSMEAALRGDATGVNRTHNDAARVQTFIFSLIGGIVAVIGIAITIAIATGR